MSVVTSLVGDPKILEVLQDRDGKVWLFYAEPFSLQIRTIGVNLDDRGDHIAVRFRYLNQLTNKKESAAAGELVPEDENFWGENQPGWEASDDRKRILKIADDFNLTMVQVVELPFLPRKSLRIVDV